MDLIQKITQKNKLAKFNLPIFLASFLGILSIVLINLTRSSITQLLHPLVLNIFLVLFTVVFFICFIFQCSILRFNNSVLSQLSQTITLAPTEVGVSLNPDKENGAEEHLRWSENIANFYSQMERLQDTDFKVDFFEYDIYSFKFSFISGMASVKEGSKEIQGEKFFKDQDFSISLSEFNEYVHISIRDNIPIRFECSAISPEKKESWFKFWGWPTKDKTRIVGAIADITREVMERNIEKKRAIHDNITGFYNRNALSEVAGKLIAESAEDEYIVFVYIGLTGYREFQERFGMVAGNSYILECAEVIKKFLTKDLVPFRWWGSDFLVLVKGIKDMERFRKGAIKTLEKIDRYIGDVDGIAVTFPLAVGYAASRVHGNNPSELIEYAAFAENEALRQVAKSPNEFNRLRYDEAHKASLRRTFIKDIINLNQLSIVFQPIVSLKTGDLLGFEALSRPVNPIYRNILELIEDAEATGHYAILEKRMIYNALDAYMERSIKYKDQYLFINTAPYATLDEHDYNDIRDRYFSHMRVVFEVTERNRMEPDDVNVGKSIVTKAGAKFALDDFGSGFSNHLALLAIEPDIIKIDRELVKGIDEDLRKQHMLEDIISYARYRGTRVLAEGVETQRELETLCRMGIDYAQGFFIGRPDPVLSEPDQRAVEVIKSISRNNQINIKQVFEIIQKSASVVNSSMGKGVPITTYLIWKVGKHLGFEGEELARLVISSMFSDIGSMYQGSTNKAEARGYSEDTIFAYIIMKEFFPYPEYVRMVLYQFVSLDYEGEVLNNISVPEEAYILSLCHSITNIILNYPTDKISGKIKELLNLKLVESKYSEVVEILSHEEIIYNILNSDYKAELYGYLEKIKITKADVDAMIRTLVYAITFRSKYTYAHARIMETTVTILARMTKQNWNLHEKVRNAALLYNLGVITMDKDSLENKHSPKVYNRILRSSLETVINILKDAECTDIVDMFSGILGQRCFSGNRLLMGKDIIIGSNMLSISDVFSSLFEDGYNQPGHSIQDIVEDLKKIDDGSNIYLPLVEMMEDFIEDIEARMNSNYADITKRYHNVMCSFEGLRNRIPGSDAN